MHDGIPPAATEEERSRMDCCGASILGESGGVGCGSTVGDDEDDDDASPSESVADISGAFLLFLRIVASKLCSKDINSPCALLLVFIHLKQNGLGRKNRN